MTPTMDTHRATTLTINRRTHAINGGHGDVGLTPREFELLSCLAEHAGCPVSRVDLLQDAWEWDNAEALKTKTVDMHVRRLRMKFEQAGLDPGLITTIRGRGYALLAV